MMTVLWNALFSKNILNEGTSISEDNSSDSELAAKVNKSILKLYGQFLSDDGLWVDYEGMKSSPLFQDFVKEAQKLVRVNLENLTETERKALFLNVYNSLVIHGQVQLGVPASTFQRLSFFQRTAYRIGPHVFSLDDIEHGLLRGRWYATQICQLELKVRVCVCER
eukprot:TRINITY_DN3256_c0_g1_i2.p1 TRINITY_DN3256_c0_g1~~TRINITY_DN3256_c0_g1_i2.p1  ORF type:complete len:166 (+),score=9.03 TRINITY_DN3256_c0_g1_i2:117-614(+)